MPPDKAAERDALIAELGASDYPDMPDEITLAEYRYEKIYPSFKAGTDEKEITAICIGASCVSFRTDGQLARLP